MSIFVYKIIFTRFSHLNEQQQLTPFYLANSGLSRFFFLENSYKRT